MKSRYRLLYFQNLIGNRKGRAEETYKKIKK